MISGRKQIPKNKDVVPFDLLVAMGTIPGVTRKQIRAYLPDIDPGDGQIYTYGSGLVKQKIAFPTGEVSLFISSSNDTDVGVVRVQYLDSNFAEQTVDITLTGQTEQTVGTDYFRIRDLRSLTGVVPIGDIYLYTTTGNTAGVPDTLASVQAGMEANTGRCADLIYTPKAGTKGFITEILTQVTASASTDITSRSVSVNPTTDIQIRGAASVFGGQESFVTPVNSGGIPEGQTFTFEVESSTNNTAMSVRLSVLEIETEVFNKYLASVN